MAKSIDFDTMRSNCIQIHQEVFEMFLVADHIGEKLDIKVKSADELKTHEETKTWDGMGRYAKELYENQQVWDQLPVSLWIDIHGNKTQWVKEKARAELLDCYYQLGGKNLY